LETKHSVEIQTITVKIRSEEQSECKIKIEKERKQCDKYQDIRIQLDLEIKKLKLQIINIEKNQNCPSDLEKCRNKIEEKTTIIIQKEKIIEKTEIRYKDCTKEEKKCKDNIVKIRIEQEKREIEKMYKTCMNRHEEDAKIIAQLKLLIKQNSAEYTMTIERIRLEHNKKVEELLQMIRFTSQISSSTKVKIESYEKTIVIVEKSIKEYEIKIKQVLDTINIEMNERDQWLDKLDTIDTTSILQISEIKQKISILSGQISQNYHHYETYYKLLIQYKSQWSKTSAELEIYRDWNERNNEMIEKYNKLKAQIAEYVDKLKKLAEEIKKIKIDNHVEIDISTYIQNIETQDPKVQFKIENAIESFKVQMAEMSRRYKIEIEKFHGLIDKEKESCNIRITTIEQSKQQIEEQCENKINIRITEITKTHETYVIQLNANYRKQIIEIKRKCTPINPQPDSLEQYNFEIYKKHCMIVIKKNREDDCKAITDIRDYYNENCIMTSLPNTKDLTTFASSDFNGSRNSDMVNRLDTKK